MSFVQMAQYTSFLPKELYFAGLRSITREGTNPGPVKDAIDVYFDAFKAVGARPDVLNAIGWDPVMIVIDAYRHIGPDATADQLKTFVDNLHGYAGTSGIYDFSDPEQRGLTISALVIDKWDPVKQDFVPASGPGGALK
jgi:hypothetical protein